MVRPKIRNRIPGIRHFRELSNIIGRNFRDVGKTLLGGRPDILERLPTISLPDLTTGTEDIVSEYERIAGMPYSRSVVRGEFRFGEIPVSGHSVFDAKMLIPGVPLIEKARQFPDFDVSQAMLRLINDNSAENKMLLAVEVQRYLRRQHGLETSIRKADDPTNLEWEIIFHSPTPDSRPARPTWQYKYVTAFANHSPKIRVLLNTLDFISQAAYATYLDIRLDWDIIASEKPTDAAIHESEHIAHARALHIARNKIRWRQIAGKIWPGKQILVKRADGNLAGYRITGIHTTEQGQFDLVYALHKIDGQETSIPYRTLLEDLMRFEIETNPLWGDEVEVEIDGKRELFRVRYSRSGSKKLLVLERVSDWEIFPIENLREYPKHGVVPKIGDFMNGSNGKPVSFRVIIPPGSNDAIEGYATNEGYASHELTAYYKGAIAHFNLADQLIKIVMDPSSSQEAKDQAVNELNLFKQYFLNNVHFTHQFCCSLTNIFNKAIEELTAGRAHITVSEDYDYHIGNRTIVLPDGTRLLYHDFQVQAKFADDVEDHSMEVHTMIAAMKGHIDIANIIDSKFREKRQATSEALDAAVFHNQTLSQIRSITEKLAEIFRINGNLTGSIAKHFTELTVQAPELFSPDQVKTALAVLKRNPAVVAKGIVNLIRGGNRHVIQELGSIVEAANSENESVRNSAGQILNEINKTYRRYRPKVMNFRSLSRHLMRTYCISLDKSNRMLFEADIRIGQNNIKVSEIGIPVVNQLIDTLVIVIIRFQTGGIMRTVLLNNVNFYKSIGIRELD